jgi:hypothetical protein
MQTTCTLQKTVVSKGNEHTLIEEHKSYIIFIVLKFI